MSKIEEFCGGINAPGLERLLHWTCRDELATIPAPGAGTHAITAPITYRAAVTGPPAVAAGKFYELNIAKEDMQFTTTRDDNGEWKTEVKVFVPKMEAEKSFILNGLTGDNLIFIAKDRNGKARLVGALTNGAGMNYKAQTNPKNGYEITFQWMSAYEPYFYESTVTV